MSTLIQAGTDRRVSLAGKVIQEMCRGYRRDFAVRFWDGTTLGPAVEPARFTLVLRHPGALRRMFQVFNQISLAEAYLFDDFDVEGDMFAFIAWVKYLIGDYQSRGWMSRLGLALMVARMPGGGPARPQRKLGTEEGGQHSKEEDRDAISYAYDIPGDFFHLFLGETMLYSCAYFADADEDVDTAQKRKLDNICRKLRLKPGDRLLDIGCGWGGLARFAAENYGADVTGVTLSRGQADWVNALFRKCGLQDRCRVVCQDYRDLTAVEEFDKATSIGVCEHIGRKNLPVYFGKIHQALKPGGVFLHHSIVLRPNTPFPPWTAFARKYVFPNGELTTILDAQTAGAAAGFEVRDVEQRREHYVYTLREWVRRLEENHDEAVRLTDEVNYRIFRLYMAGATMGFESGVYGLYQTLFLKPQGGMSGLPLTRADWYC